jgi:hypothetical protein
LLMILLSQLLMIQSQLLAAAAAPNSVEASESAISAFI